jgi:DNA polymerase III sliding clamp (beta) subunit (PCNA family)
MKLPNKINPMHCASTDATRYILNGVFLTGDLAVATNGRTLFATVGTRDDEDDARDALIPTKAAKAAWPQRKGKASIVPMLTVNAKVENETPTVTILDKDFDKTTIKEIEGNFPNFEAVIPDVSKPRHVVGLNVKLLMQIAKCFGEDDVMIHLDPDGFRHGCQGEAMLVTNGNNQNAVAVLMPMRVFGYVPVAENKVIKKMIARREAREAREAMKVATPKPAEP